MNLKNFIWLTPFLAFFSGYYLTNIFFTINETSVPNVIGKQINEAARLLSEHNLNLRILAHKEDADLPDGTVIDQKPINQKIKVNKPVYLVITKKQKEFKAPNFTGKNLEEIKKQSDNLGIKIKIYYLDNDQKENICISQFPEPEKILENNQKVIVYISKGNNKPIIFPDMKNQNLKDVLNFLNLHQLQYNITVANFGIYDQSKEYQVLDQRPLPGSLINLNKKQIVQIHVREIL